MAWKKADIKAAYDKGESAGATHMIVAWDSFDDTNYAIYVMSGENPRDKVPSNGDIVDECYRYSLGWDMQSKEHRARHFEYKSGTDKPKVLSAEEVKTSANIVLRHGVVLPYTIPAYPRLNTEARSGEVFVSIEDLEELQDTDSFSHHLNGLNSAQGHALVDAGWARKSTGGGLYATEEYQASANGKTIFDRILARLDTALDADTPDRRVQAIWFAFSDNERDVIATLVHSRDDG